jgi:hypothetical protein
MEWPYKNKPLSNSYPEEDSLARAAVDEMKVKLARERLVESACIYAEVYAQEKQLRELTEAALEDWPKFKEACR